MEKRNILGGILIVLGIIWLLESINFINVDLTLVIIASVLMILYFLSAKSSSDRNVALLIAGSVVLMIGIQSIIDSMFFLGDMEGVLFFIFLGSAFWLVYFIHYRQLGGVNWTVYVGTSLYVFSAIIFFSEYLNRGFFKYIWAVALIIIGLYIIFKDKIKNI